MLNRVRSLVTVLALGLPVVAVADRVAPPRKRPDPVTTFLQQDKYTYCDVKVLSALWQQSIGETKATVGMKLQGRGEQVLESELTAARQHARKHPQARCTFGDAGFSYADAKKLAGIWKTSPAKAKAIAEQKILNGAEHYVRGLITPPAAVATAEDPVSTFLKQDRYSYCHVKLLAEHWKQSVTDAKATVGLKLQNGAERYLDSELGAARRGTRLRCNWQEAGFTYNDVETLARLWKMSVSDAKSTIASKAMGPGAYYLLQEVRNAGPVVDEAELAAFAAQDKYTYCDAKMVSAMWKQSAHEAKALIGAKLKARAHRALSRIIGDARKHARTHEEARCSFHDAGFSYDDAVLLAGMWRKSAGEVKAMVGMRIAMGQEAAIRAQLVRARAKPRRPPPPPPRPMSR